MVGLHIRPKREFHLWSWVFGFALLIAIAICSWYAYRWYTTGEEPPIPVPVSAMSPKVDESNVSASQVESYTVPASHPRYISIPSLGIDKKRVFPVGVTDTGELATPANINDTAWYEKSATPGMGYGAVMIDAHSGGYTKAGVFSNLASLKDGDLVTIERGDSKLFSYKVVSNQTMTLDEANASGMKELMQSAQPNKEGLSLISCTGNYVPKLGTFDHRVMIRAVITDN